MKFSVNVQSVFWNEEHIVKDFNEAIEYAKNLEQKYYEKIRDELKGRNIVVDIYVGNDFNNPEYEYKIKIACKNKVLTSTWYYKNEHKEKRREIMDSKKEKKMKKYNIGDSINFKDGRVGIVEDYDDEYYYVKDNNTNIVKIKKVDDVLLRKYFKTNREFLGYCENLVKTVALKLERSNYYHKHSRAILNIIFKLARGESLSSIAKTSEHMNERMDYIIENFPEEEQEKLINEAYETELKAIKEIDKYATNRNSLGQIEPNPYTGVGGGMEVYGSSDKQFERSYSDSKEINDRSRLAYEYEPEPEENENIDSFETEEEKELRKEAEQKYSEDIEEESKYYTNADLEKAINNALNTLTEREKMALELRYGLNGEKPYTLKELGQYFNVSYDRIRQIIMRAERKLKHPSRSKLLSPYYYNEQKN